MLAIMVFDELISPWRDTAWKAGSTHVRVITTITPQASRSDFEKEDWGEHKT